MVTLTNELQLEILLNRERERSEKGEKGDELGPTCYRGVASVPGWFRRANAHQIGIVTNTESH